MDTRIWHFLVNSFMIVTTGSYRAMRVIANYTLDALNIPLNTFIFNLHGNLQPFVTAFLNAYDAWLAQLGTKISAVNSYYIALETLRSTDSKLWDRMVQTFYARGSTLYLKYLPHGKKDLQSGSQEDKHAEVERFALILVGDANMASLLALVNAKLTIMNGLKSAKNTGKSSANIFSDAVETARIALAKELYGVLGNLMYHFRDNPTLITPFFDITNIRNLDQTIWERKLKAFVQKYVFTRTLTPLDSLRLVNNSLFPIRFAMLLNKTDVIGVTYVEVPPMTGVTVLRPALGPISNHCMHVENMGAGVAKYMIVII